MVSYTGNLSEVKFFDPIEAASEGKVTDSLENFQAAFNQTTKQSQPIKGANEIQNHTIKKTHTSPNRHVIIFQTPPEHGT